MDISSRVLELGCGTGILGMSISRTSNDDTNLENSNRNMIVLTDGDLKAIELLRSNLANVRNLIDLQSVQAIHLPWFTKEDRNYESKRQRFLQSVKESFSSSSKYRRLNEKQYAEEHCTTAQHNTKAEKNDCYVYDEDVLFDFIIAGDVLYKHDLLPLFFGTVTAFLKKTGTLYLCHIPRNNVTHDMVQEFATEAGFAYNILPIPSSLSESQSSASKVDDSDDDLRRFPVEDIERASVYQISFAS